jgi:hypothetical protein
MKKFFIWRTDGKRFVGGEGRVQWKKDPETFIMWDDVNVARRVAADLRKAGHECDVEPIEID